jgi:AraC family transcriptional regulator
MGVLRKRIVTELSSPPVASSVHRPWSGMTVQLHDWKSGGSVTSPAVDHDFIAMRVTGRVRLVQERAGTVSRMVAVPGNVTIHARGFESRWSWDGPGAILIARVSSDMLLEAADAVVPRPRAVELTNCFGVRDRFIEPILNLFALELSRPPHPAQELISGYLSSALATHLIQRFDRRMGFPTPAQAALGPHALRRTLDFLHESSGSPVTFTALSDIAGVSRFEFARRFRRSTGQSFLEYMRRISPHEARVAQVLPRSRGGLAHWQVRRVTSYMQDHLEQDVTLDELAALVGLSGAHFCTAFRTSVGLTPREWVIQRRMERARELLANPKLSITEIALTLGYSPSAFGEVFRRRMGVTPSAYRRSI